MGFVLDILLCICLGIIVFQDFRYRAIHIVLIIAVFVAGLLNLYFQGEPTSKLLGSLSFVSIIMLSVWLYLSLKQRKFIKILTRGCAYVVCSNMFIPT